MNFLVHLQENFLDYVQALFSIQGDTVGDAKELSFISPDENTKCFLLPLLKARDQPALIPGILICFVRHQ
jgi:hypothetical protein